MDMNGPFIALLVALGIGLVIGLEREQDISNEGPEAARFHLGGARTYPLIALSGALSMMLAKQIGAWAIGLMLAGLIAFLLVNFSADVKGGRDRGITSEVAMVMTFLIGALALSEGVAGTHTQTLFISAALGVATTTLLSFKAPLHLFAQKVSRDDIYAAVKFLILTVIVLPLLPNESMGPLDAFNPFTVGMMVVMIAGIGFVGYIAVRLLGSGRGLGVTGLVGGLASSTAVTLSMSNRAKTDPKIGVAAALAVLLASTVMLARMMVMVAVVFEPLLKVVVLPIGAMSLGGLVASVVYYFRSRKNAVKSEEMKLENPFELKSAMKWAALFTLVLFAAKAATHYFGQGGSYVAGVITGTTDVDAITLTMSKLASEGLHAKVAATAIVLAAMSNTVVKAIMTISIGGWAFGKRTLVGFGAMLALGAVGLGVLWGSW